MLGFFHIVIISIIILNLSGCGYKKPPYYEENIDKNVKIIIKDKKSEE